MRVVISTCNIGMKMNSMNNLYRLISKVPNYVRQFGLVDGLRLLVQIEKLNPLPQKSDRIAAYKVPGYGSPIYLRNCVGDHAIFWQCLVMNQYDFSQFPQSKRLNEIYADSVNAGTTPVIIDCGGNIGLSAIWFAEQFPKAKILCIEPEESNFDLLQRNIQQYAGRVVAMKGGVWSEPGTLSIVNPDAGPSAFRVQLQDMPATANTIRCYTMDELLAAANTTAPLIVKIDIEGAQADLFSKNTDWVIHTDLITLELDDWQFPWQGTSRSFFKCLSNHPFDYLMGGESIFCFNDKMAERRIN